MVDHGSRSPRRPGGRLLAAGLATVAAAAALVAAAPAAPAVAATPAVAAPAVPAPATPAARPAAAPTAATPPAGIGTPAPLGACTVTDRPVGFAAVDAWGQNTTTGGTGGPEVEVDTATEFLTAIAQTGPLSICVRGMIALPGPMHDVTSDKTIVGLGSNSGFTGGGLNIGLPISNVTTPPANAVHNVIVRNLVFRSWRDDAVNVQMFSHHVWIDHNDLASGFDGAIDVKRGSSYVTVSWNHTHNHTKNMLLGHDDNNGAQDVGRLKVSYHHNWFDATPQRNPRVRFGEPVHVFNNYYFRNSDVGVACQANAGCLIEGNYFESVEEPATNRYAGPSGRCVARNNVFTGNEPGQPVCSGTVEEASRYYSYRLDTPNNVKSIVTAGAGVGRIGVQAQSQAATATPAGAMPLATLVVATNGNDANPGSLDRPLRTIQRAVDLARPGDVITIRGGIYAPTRNIRIVTSGTSSQPITMMNYQGERVLIDGEGMPHTPAPLDASIPRIERGAIHLAASFWRFVGLEIANGPYAIFGLNTGNNVFDRLVTRDNYESGLHLQGTSANNLILNLDSFGNRDPRKNGESADGLAIKEGSGSGNVVRGARLWNNVDDGFDAWEFLSPITIENSVAWGNGVNRWGFPNFGGDGNGFKLGGGDEDLPANHVVRNSVAFDNTAGGFIDNANPGSMRLERSTAWRNRGTGFDTADSRSTLTANLSASNGTAVSLGSSTSSGNSWNLGGTWNDSSLVSTDPRIMAGPRQPDGRIASSNFLVPVNGANIGARF